VAERTVLVEGGRPTELASILRNLPGVALVAVGRRAASTEAVFEALGNLARTYLKKRTSFAVTAWSGASELSPSDVRGRGTSTVLDAVKGARVKEHDPQVQFTVTLDKSGGTAGVVIGTGPGGIPTGDRWVRCLVSGGMHSSVMAWLALLSGFRVELVHAMVDDESLLRVARLYAELSHRVDPGALVLRVIEGSSIAEALARWSGEARETFVGAHAWSRNRASGATMPGTAAPLYLLPEEDFERNLASLSLRDYDGPKHQARAPGTFRERFYGGRRADVNAVLDGLR
jgi:adenylyl- and sulfurtransferase ThiI